MKRMLMIVLAVALVLLGCGDDDDDTTGRTDTTEESQSADVPPCSEVAAEGVTVSEDLLDLEGCVTEAGLVQDFGVFECEDGRQLVANGDGYGYVGEEWTEVIWASVSAEVLEAC